MFLEFIHKTDVFVRSTRWLLFWALVFLFAGPVDVLAANSDAQAWWADDDKWSLRPKTTGPNARRNRGERRLLRVVGEVLPGVTKPPSPEENIWPFSKAAKRFPKLRVLNKDGGRASGAKVILVGVRLNAFDHRWVGWSSRGTFYDDYFAQLEAFLLPLLTQKKFEWIGASGKTHDTLTSSKWASGMAGVVQQIQSQWRFLEPDLLEFETGRRLVNESLRSMSPAAATYLRWRWGPGLIYARLKYESPAAFAKLKVLNLRGKNESENAVNLRKKIARLSEKNPVMIPNSRLSVSSLRKLWKQEYSEYRDNFLTPLDEKLGEFRRFVRMLRRDGDVDLSRSLGRFLGQLRVMYMRLYDENLLDGIHAYFETYPSDQSPRGKAGREGVELTRQKRKNLHRKAVTVQKLFGQLNKLERKWVLDDLISQLPRAKGGLALVFVDEAHLGWISKKLEEKRLTRGLVIVGR
ncbi:MAG: hypothetical protein VYA34_12795 [Myxococcota bacterium]|nr:hypothetical protein [Myxococcota bacterium]